MKDTILVFADDKMIIQEPYRIENVCYKDIICFQYEMPYIIILKVDGKEHFVKKSISGIVEMLPNNFLLCNRTTIVNLLYVKKINLKTDIVMTNERMYSLSRSRRKDFMTIFLNVRSQKIICRKCDVCNSLSPCVNML
jgi:DNA-binding LytR/AlgR family response regulator